MTQHIDDAQASIEDADAALYRATDGLRRTGIARLEALLGVLPAAIGTARAELAIDAAAHAVPAAIDAAYEVILKRLELEHLRLTGIRRDTLLGPIPLPDPPLPPGVRYADVSGTRVAPLSVGIDSPTQHGAPTCLLHAGAAAVFDADPRPLHRAVRMDAHQNVVVVDVPGGRYVLEPTIPVNDAGDPSTASPATVRPWWRSWRRPGPSPSRGTRALPPMPWLSNG